MWIGMGLLVLTAVLASLGYIAAGWGVVDAIYMVIITIFGVGYGEVRPIESPLMKMYTGFVIVAGCSTGIYVVGGFVQMVAEGEIHRALGARKMSLGIEQATDHAIICGFGRVGQILASELQVLGRTFVCVDTDKERIALAEARGYLVVLGNAGEEETLRQAGIARARAIAAVLPDDAANVFITLTAREIREDIEIIARGELIETKRKLLRSGATHVVLPAAIGASKIANIIHCPDEAELIINSQLRDQLNLGLQALGLTLSEVVVEANSAASKCRVSEIELQHKSGVVIAAIQSADGTVRRNPAAEEVVVAGDRLYVVSHKPTGPALIKQTKVKGFHFSLRGSR
jgi:voltage-gated potassium channel